MSSTDRDCDEGQDERSTKKKVRAESVTTTVAEEDETGRESSSTPLPQRKDTDAEGLKEVTKGVKEVELEDSAKTAPESVPLPAVEAGELDDVAAVTTPPPETQVETQEDIAGEVSSVQNESVAIEKPKDTSSAALIEGAALTDNREGGISNAAPAVQKPIAKEAPAKEVGGPKKLRGKSRMSKKVEVNSLARE